MQKHISDILFQPIKPRSMASKVGSHLRRRLLAGLVTMTPIVVTVWVSIWIFNLAANSNWLESAADFTRISDRKLAVTMALLTTIALVYVVGLLSSTITLRQIIVFAERMLVRIPVIKLFYVTTKQLLDTLNLPGGTKARKIVVVEYPRPGCYAFGFATGESVRNGDVYVHVFVPATPVPASGWLVLLRIGEVWESNYSGEEAMKMILSGGIVCKESLELRPYTRMEPAAEQ
jgi:uncharacterized membrane protein